MKFNLPLPDSVLLSNFRADIVGALTIVVVLTAGANNATGAPRAQYDLVYLATVQAPELKTEGQARIEPLFLTDGTNVVFLFDYCRGYVEKILKTQLKRRGWIFEGHWKRGYPIPASRLRKGVGTVIGNYCLTKEFALDGRLVHALSNGGLELKLGPIRFSGGETYHSAIIGPDFVDPGEATILAVERAPWAQDSPVASISGTCPRIEPRHYFFLMAADRSILEKIVIRVKGARADLARLLAAGCDSVEPRRMVKRIEEKYEYGTRSRPFRSEVATVIAPLIWGDFDGDGREDLVLGMQVPDKNNWNVLRVLFGRGAEIYLGGVSGGTGADEYPDFLPFGIAKLGSCTYLLTSLDDVSWRRIHLLRLGGLAKLCKDLGSKKHPDDFDNVNPPY
ncbi:MAG: hypothetical protein EXR27_09920 [Betaproteobacteria bacterium]|nr:hypothetical protein [Betaproteobacteria bacterium]